MPFGTRTPDDGTKAVPPTRFGIMGDPETHTDLKKPNPMTPEVIADAQGSHGSQGSLDTQDVASAESQETTEEN